MRGIKKGGEILNRCITAIAMTFAIATISGLLTEGQIVRGDVLRQQIQTVLNLYKPELRITQDPSDSQESLATLVLINQGKTSGY